MANETDYYFNRLILYKEDSENTIPTNPKGKEINGLIQHTVKEVQKTEKNPNLNGGGQSTKKDRGTSDFSGNIECKTMGDIMPFIATHCFGDPASKVAASTTAWAASTAYTKFDPYDSALATGDIVTHSNGINMLVCYKAGTSDATEPSQSAIDAALAGNGKLTDGTVVWYVRKNLWKYTGESESCLSSFGMELRGRTSCGALTVDFNKRYQQCYLQSFEIMKQNGQIIHKYAMPVVAGYAVDDQIDGSFASITAESGYTNQKMRDSAFQYDDLRVEFDGAEPINARNFRMMVNRNVSLEDATKQNTKISNIPIMEIEGEISLKFTKEEYEKCYNNEADAIKCLMGKDNGDIFHTTFRYVERDRVDPDWSTNEPAYITTPLTASGDDDNKTFSYAIISELDY